MTGTLVQVNRSPGGLPKSPVAGPVMMSEACVEGDQWRHPQFHGGPQKAVLMASAEFIDALAARGYPVYYGALGENLTVAGMDPHLWRAGQRYRVGESAVIELTTLRVPCKTLNMFGPGVQKELYDPQCKAGDVDAKHWALGGFYGRVVRAGMIAAGDLVRLESEMAKVAARSKRTHSLL